MAGVGNRRAKMPWMLRRRSISHRPSAVNAHGIAMQPSQTGHDQLLMDIATGPRFAQPHAPRGLDGKPRVSGNGAHDTAVDP